MVDTNNDQRIEQAEEALRAVDSSLRYMAALIGDLTDRISTIEFRQEREVVAWRSFFVDLTRAEKWEPPEPGSEMPLPKHGPNDVLQPETVPARDEAPPQAMPSGLQITTISEVVRRQ